MAKHGKKVSGLLIGISNFLYEDMLELAGIFSLTFK
jgi:hypothetical protein